MFSLRRALCLAVALPGLHTGATSWSPPKESAQHAFIVKDVVPFAVADIEPLAVGELRPVKCREWHSWSGSPPADDSLGLECGFLGVPLDYGDRSAGTGRVYYTRLPARSAQSRRGTIFLSPDLAGGSTMNVNEYAKLSHDAFIERALTLRRLTGDTFDIVTWRVRGAPDPAGATIDGERYNILVETAQSLKRDPNRGRKLERNATYEIEQDVRLWSTFQATILRRCLETMDARLVKYVGTAATARDLAALADALDGPGRPVHFLGTGQASLIGSYFLKLFPQMLSILLSELANYNVFMQGEILDVMPIVCGDLTLEPDSREMTTFPTLANLLSNAQIAPELTPSPSPERLVIIDEEHPLVPVHEQLPNLREASAVTAQAPIGTSTLATPCIWGRIADFLLDGSTPPVSRCGDDVIPSFLKGFASSRHSDTMAAVADALPFPAFANIPSSDRAQLAGLSRSGVQAWVCSRAQEYLRFASALHSLHNSLTPIHCALPPEILAEIFEQYVYNGQNPFVLAHTCRTWREIALDTPRLWASAAVSPMGPLYDLSPWYDGELSTRQQQNRIEFTSAMLSWSKALPIPLVLFGGIPKAIREALAPHTGRIVSLVVEMNSEEAFWAFFSLLEHGAESLETLQIQVERLSTTVWTDDAAPQRVDTSWNLPVLRTLSSVPLDMFTYLSRPTLQAVCITDPVFRMTPLSPFSRFESRHTGETPLASFVSALEQCTGLQDIRVNLMEMLHEFAPGWGGPSQTANLPSLYRLIIRSSQDPSILPAFLASISPPAHTFISLNLPFSIPNNDLWDALSRDANVQERTPFMAYSTVVLRAVADDSSWIRVSGWSGTQPECILFTVYCGCLSTPDAHLDWFDGLFSIICAAPSMSGLTLYLEEPSFRGRDQLAVLFRRCPFITHLVLHGIFAGDALYALGAPSDSSPLCPNLATLVVHFPVSAAPGYEGYGVWTALDARGEGWEDELRASMVARRDALVGTLSGRAARGTRLTTLTWWERAWDGPEPCQDWEASAVIDEYEPDASWCDLTELRALVDGEVKFGGFSYERKAIYESPVGPEKSTKEGFTVVVRTVPSRLLPYVFRGSYARLPHRTSSMREQVDGKLFDPFDTFQSPMMPPNALPLEIGELRILDDCFDPHIHRMFRAMHPGNSSTVPECGLLGVPLDYHNASAGVGQVRYLRLPASPDVERKGTILLQSGSPLLGDRHEESVDLWFVPYSSLASNSTAGAYDIVTWRIRGALDRAEDGTVPSAVKCFTDAAERAEFFRSTAIALDYSPDWDDWLHYGTVPTARDTVAWAAIQEKLVQHCLDKTDREMLKYVGTAATARDAVALVDAFDGPDSRVNFWGGGHGSVIGDYILQLFPGRVGRMVFDAPADPQESIREETYKQWVSQMQHANDVVTNYFRDCAGSAASGTGCYLSSSGDEWPMSFLVILNLKLVLGTLRTTMVDWENQLEVNMQNEALLALLEQVYDNTNHTYEYDDMFSDDFKLPPRDLSHFFDAPGTRPELTVLRTLGMMPVRCGDIAGEHGTAGPTNEELVAGMPIAPLIIPAAFPSLDYMCHLWPHRAVERLSSFSPPPAGSGERLLVIHEKSAQISLAEQLRHLPYASAATAQAFFSAQLFGPSECSWERIGAFLRDGTYPPPVSQPTLAAPTYARPSLLFSGFGLALRIARSGELP
ncbi:uncharacterized protein BXZ73DRAFT_100591 [Epithele typhae]|uniref:uncharacterized protein n=1 Tax=Epithele typhae TaxID=378194 RepID=UPI00200823FC|nr:uncharacterized protein BXZ73DRAFT_100591 [Epithele typhae]KAH9935204.1 hypothetical protein BXZ73DRAFT_100591 [Epithele typhae]